MTLRAFDVNLFCADPEALMGFYRDLLGLEEVVAARSPIYRELRLGAASLGFNATAAYGLLDLADRVPTDRGVTAYATFQLEDEAAVDALAARVPALGGRIVKPAYRTYYAAWQVVAEDPDGNVFRLNHAG